MKDDENYLRHILIASQKIEKYVKGMSMEALSGNDLVLDAVLRELQVIGEAARHLSDSGIRRYSQVPWEQIRGMRNRVIHEYFDVDVEVVWKTCTEDIPLLRRLLSQTHGDSASAGSNVT